MSDLTCLSCGGKVEQEHRFCPNCGFDLQKTISCPKCNYQNEPNSKFCQECGAALRNKLSTEARTIEDVSVVAGDASIEPAPREGICIEFPYTTAQSFDFAVKEAKKLASFKQYGQDKKAIYRVTIARDELKSVTDLLEQLKGWRKRTVYLDGQKVQWDSIFGYCWCFTKKASSYKPEYYCYGYENEYELNLWGCIQAHMPFNEQGRWTCWGKWLNSKGDWQFDKDHIKHELEKVLYNFRFCPALSTERIEVVLSAIPSVVNPKKDRNWKFVENYGDESSEGFIMQVERFGVQQIVSMKGVSPNGKAVLVDIAKRLKLSLPI